MSSNLVVIPPGRGHSSQLEVTRTIGIDIIVGRYPEGAPLPRDAELTAMGLGRSYCVAMSCIPSIDQGPTFSARPIA